MYLAGDHQLSKEEEDEKKIENKLKLGIMESSWEINGSGDE